MWPEPLVGARRPSPDYYGDLETFLLLMRNGMWPPMVRIKAALK
jgi:hypothetical protein